MIENNNKKEHILPICHDMWTTKTITKQIVLNMTKRNYFHFLNNPNTTPQYFKYKNVKKVTIIFCESIVNMLKF